MVDIRGLKEAIENIRDDGAVERIAALERQIAELRAERDHWRQQDRYNLKAGQDCLVNLEAAEAENARLRALPLKDEVERVLEQIADEYGIPGPWDEKFKTAQSLASALLSRLRAGEQEGWRLVPVERIEAWISYLRQRGIDFSDMEGWLATVAAHSEQGGDRDGE